MKSTMLAAAGQLNLNIEQRAKQGHHKQSVQLYSRDDVWPSLFLQRDILIEIGSGWRPLTSQARGARQPLPEPSFTSPPITEEDLQCLQMSTRSKNPDVKPLTVVEPTQQTTAPSNTDDKSSSSDSDSSSSSDEDFHVPQVHTSILVINKKSHIIHAASQISSNSVTRSRFKIRDKCFEVTCGSSITGAGAPVDIIDSIPSGARVCQRKTCLAALDHLLT